MDRRYSTLRASSRREEPTGLRRSDLIPVVAWDRSVTMRSVPVTTTCLFIRLKLPRPSAFAPGIVKSRLVNWETPSRKLTCRALNSTATVGAAVSVFVSFFLGAVPLARWLNASMVLLRFRMRKVHVGKGKVSLDLQGL